jgi:multidrug transporter EmrE-like cation transporter
MTLPLGILLALGCALASNIGFLYKHRGACAAPPVDMRRPLRTAISLWRSRWFAIGMAVATGAWLFHVAAMAMAPLSVVQAVLGGGVVLIAVLAERLFGLRVGRRQWIGLILMAVGLVLLGLTLPAIHGAHSRFSVPGMISFEAILVTAGTLLIMGPRIGAPAEHHGFMLGAAAGILFGVSDIAIKAISGIVGSAGISGFLSPWMVLTVAASVAAFYASAKALQDGEAVPVIAVTGTAANVAGIVGGIIVFGDPMSANPIALAAESLAFVLVLAAGWLMPAPVRAAAVVRAA